MGYQIRHQTKVKPTKETNKPGIAYELIILRSTFGPTFYVGSNMSIYESQLRR